MQTPDVLAMQPEIYSILWTAWLCACQALIPRKPPTPAAGHTRTAGTRPPAVTACMQASGPPSTPPEHLLLASPMIYNITIALTSAAQDLSWGAA